MHDLSLTNLIHTNYDYNNFLTFNFSKLDEEKRITKNMCFYTYRVVQNKVYDVI